MVKTSVLDQILVGGGRCSLRLSLTKNQTLLPGTQPSYDASGCLRTLQSSNLSKKPSLDWTTLTP